MLNNLIAAKRFLDGLKKWAKAVELGEQRHIRPSYGTASHLIVIDPSITALRWPHGTRIFVVPG
ncbi:hypothetical protein [Sinorhizobium meliloti]|uniref:hypothetical protein n=1 Tax=Rhizobium meliloti TaxID=382 RepID=UPI0020905F22|nr:hypothetical protein [Sinorhizobium meliloti]MCO5963679.1 hypothetical protein [Sinorhizobium meliloti]